MPEHVVGRIEFGPMGAHPATDVWTPGVLPKREPGGDRDYVPITWPFFRRLRGWCRWVAHETGCTAFLVGSALEKDEPRDVDIALVWDDATYTRHFGPIPASQAEYDAKWQTDFQWARHAFTVSAWKGVGYKPYIDVHLCPSSWYVERPRLALGSRLSMELAPEAVPDDWNFALMSIVSDDKTLFAWLPEAARGGEAGV